jgi:uncharacterized membrane protein YqjE
VEQYRERPPVSELVGEITGDVQRLVRDEIRLARIELTQSLREGAIGAAGLVVAGAMAYLGVWFVGLAVFWAIFLAIPGWAASLSVAAGFFIIAGIALLYGRSRLKPSQLRPEQTIETLEEDREWLERRIR